MDNVLIARLSSLLEEEDPLVLELIIDTVKQVEESQLSVEAHAKKLERVLDRKLMQMGGGGK
ncbi:hypothetical protein [Bacillus sp. EB01]|uniref:hypothetical protein n=1 Tax=Bacillus sp. EB01 TaxID=1347086 RepID=UPI0005C5AFA6|nr:hypothetical protein [Bacillus sp. EB01]